MGPVFVEQRQFWLLPNIFYHWPDKLWPREREVSWSLVCSGVLELWWSRPRGCLSCPLDWAECPRGREIRGLDVQQVVLDPDLIWTRGVAPCFVAGPSNWNTLYGNRLKDWKYLLPFRNSVWYKYFCFPITFTVYVSVQANSSWDYFLTPELLINKI